jgi:6-pyruvoyl-tetrahydropterin synthase-like protein
MSRSQRTSSITRGLPVLGVSLLLLVALTWPLLFTYSGFSGDWTHHLWLMWHQSLAIQSSGYPSFFLNSSYSVLYPTYAFYGGTLYAIGGALSLLLGGAPVSAYVLVYVLDFAAAFGGWYWLARQAGVGRWLAIVPGLVFVTSAYYMVVIYVQGDWPEFTGISMIPLMLAAGLSVVRGDRVRAREGLALALSSVLFFGSHNITILLGLSTIVVSGLAVLVFVPEARRFVTFRGMARVAGIVAPAAAVSAWYLLPTLAYESSTRLGSEEQHARETLRSTSGLVSLDHLFTFSRTSGPGLPPPYYLALSLPVLAIVWLLVGILVLPRLGHSRMLARLLLVCSGMTVVVLVLMTHVGLLLALPRQYSLIQFSYRLETYVLLTLCAAILVALALARGGARRARAWAWMAIPVCAVSLIGAVLQISSYSYPGQDRYVTMAYPGEVETGDNRDFQDVSVPAIATRNTVAVEIPYTMVHDDRVTFTTHARPGTLLATNIGAGPQFVHVSGAKAVGVDAETGNMVLQVDGQPSAAAGARDVDVAAATATEERITVSTGDGVPVVLGRLLSLAGLAILILEMLALVAARARRRVVIGDIDGDLIRP